jgi:two-component system chemotaxis response regulator CheB
MTQKKIKVLVVDDSMLIRQLLTQILDADPGIEVVASACDPYEAREKIKIHHPDVLTLDVEMPKMDGITFLKNLMRLRPMPVVMISTLTEKGAAITLQALETGAFDYLAKPKVGDERGWENYQSVIVEKVKGAATANVGRAVTEKKSPLSGSPEKLHGSKVDLIAIGASTGGTEAIKEVVSRLPRQVPPIVVTQHIPPVFSTSYAKRLNQTVALEVSEVDKSGIELLPEHVYIAPGDQHLTVKKRGNTFVTQLLDTELVNRHKPAVDVLFQSVLEAAGARTIGVLLTGMGADGAKGLKALRDGGAYTIAQDEASSVVWGMPGAAVRLEAADDIVALPKIPERLLRKVYANKK